jgi:hypothetical protein
VPTPARLSLNRRVIKISCSMNELLEVFRPIAAREGSAQSSENVEPE